MHLPSERSHASRFGKARLARSNALREDYVELIADLLVTEGEARPTNIARRLGVSHVSVVKAIARPNRDELVVGRPYRGVFLTTVGSALAEQVRLRHRIVIDLLRAVGVPTEAAEADAKGIRHHVSNTTLKAFERYLQMRLLPITVPCHLGARPGLSIRESGSTPPSRARAPLRLNKTATSKMKARNTRRNPS
jgi:DtxR family transcriptional regulator, manganese transport regulator